MGARLVERASLCLHRLRGGSRRRGRPVGAGGAAAGGRTTGNPGVASHQTASDTGDGGHAPFHPVPRPARGRDGAVGAALTFLDALLARSASYTDTACLTLTAIHPDGKHPTPSRHIPLHQPALLADALDALLAANRQDWGAFVAVGLRKPGLTRWKRGGEADIVALPALFVDVDDPSPDTLAKLRILRPTPSCITFTGGGFHAYWWLDAPLADLGRARRLLRGLGRAAGGDRFSVAQSLRLAGSRNTKPWRGNARCRIVELHDTHYPVQAFDHLLPRQTTPQVAQTPRKTVVRASDGRLNPILLDAVTGRLLDRGYARQGDWLSGPCLYPAHHHNDDAHPSFGFNTHTGYGHCFRCGSILLKDMCAVLGIRGADYGGFFA
ncbi:MAG: hypothetical protein H6672_13430 [Anaerolineaceae bacterium]|nr:hypothetical protein [Anaerolineaceae bacterium]